MSINKTKYRPAIYFISICYLNFFFLFPFFHHHHSESEYSYEENEMVHSHLFNDVDDGEHPNESYHHYEDEIHHYHLSKNKNIFSNPTSREFQSLLNIQLYLILNNSVIDLEISAIGTPSFDGFFKHQWDKYVLSAANISPPLV